jgi:hypothetical protein
MTHLEERYNSLLFIFYRQGKINFVQNFLLESKLKGVKYMLMKPRPCAYCDSLAYAIDPIRFWMTHRYDGFFNSTRRIALPYAGCSRCHRKVTGMTKDEAIKNWNKITNFIAPLLYNNSHSYFNNLRKAGGLYGSYTSFMPVL